MVVGLDRWRDHFANFADRYVLVGGVACEQLMDEAGLAFRATKDFDVVLLVELLDAGFADAFWAFIEAGGYERREKAEGGKLYRFQRPTAPDYPQMIELFSRAPEGFDLAPGSQLTPLPIDEAAASLSAILLDSGYYDFLRENARMVDGLPLLGEAALIPFKARAYLDLTVRKSDGKDIDSRTIKKHRNDVFRMLQLLPEGAVQHLPDAIKADMAAFVEAVGQDDSFKPADFNVKFPPAARPDFLGTFHPDAIATGKAPNLLIEVITPRGSGEVEATKVRQLRQRLAGHPDWKLEILYTAPSMPLPGVASIEAIRRRFGDVRRLADTDRPAALVVAWSVLEAVARRLLPKRARRALAPGTAVELLTSLGHIAQTEATAP